MPGDDLILDGVMVVAFAGAAVLILAGFWACHRLKPSLAAHEPELFGKLKRAWTHENAILAVALNRRQREALHPSVQPGLDRIVRLHRLSQLCLAIFAVAFIASQLTWPECHRRGKGLPPTAPSSSRRPGRRTWRSGGG